jgi:hypothetical protein
MAQLSQQQCIERAIVLENDADDATPETRRMMLALAKEWRVLAAETPNQPLRVVPRTGDWLPSYPARTEKEDQPLP